MITTRTGIIAPRGAPWAIALAVAVCATLLASVETPAQTKSAKKSQAVDSTRSGRLARPPLERGVERVRTLDAINIEGEIAVPQVLFITARDVRRYRDGMGLKFQLSATEAGRSAVLPSRLRVAPQSQSNKEE
jgi:hypothetical protein